MKPGRPLLPGAGHRCPAPPKVHRRTTSLNKAMDCGDLPGDMVTTSGSGLDPHITLQNAEYQLDRVASKWAADLKRDQATVRKEIERIVQENASAPWFGLAGEKMVNVLEVNLELARRYGTPK